MLEGKEFFLDFLNLKISLLIAEHPVAFLDMCTPLFTKPSCATSGCVQLQHPVEFPTVCYALNTTASCRISHCVLLTE